MTAWDPVGAHEVLLENPRHDGHLWNASDAEVEQFLRLAAQRIQDLKRDSRFKYISIFKNHGDAAGQEFDHPTSQLTATTFVPRRVLYELRAGRDYFETKERCVFCDILAQEERQNLRILESRGDYVAFCPYAPRVPYETWILPRSHESSFERTGSARVGSVTDLAALLRRTLSVFAPSPRTFTLCFTPRPTANILRQLSDIGRRSTRITTGISKSCPSSRPKPGRTRLKRFIIPRSLRKRL